MDNIFKRFKRVFSFILVILLIVGSTGLENVFAETGNKQYSMEELSVLSADELVKVLSTSYYKDITGLYSYSDGAIKIYSDEVKMDAIRRAIEIRGREYTENDDKGLDTLIYFIRSGYYLGIDEKEGGSLKHLSTREYRDKCIPAIISIQRNPNFKLGTETQNLLVGSVGEFIENASSNAEIVNNFTPILEDFNDNLSEYVNDRSKSSAIYKILSGVKRDIDTYINQECRCELKIDFDPEENECNCHKELEDAPWFERIDGFIEVVEKFTQAKDTKENELILDNALFTISTLGSLHSDNTIGNKALTDGMKNYEYLSNSYLRAAMEIALNHGEIDYYGRRVAEDELKEAAEKRYYGETYVFDDGDIVIKAGDKVRKDKILKIYWGLKEVEAQFFRAIGSDEILDEYLIDVYFLEEQLKEKYPEEDIYMNEEGEEVFEKYGRTDRQLTIIIYNSPDEYNINNVLNGIETMNGGIYIKNLGTFYTYERTNQQSKYTVEELARHEFTHYLQGKHVFNGNWNVGEFYGTGNVYWYEEGGAEYFAGSTRTEGVVPRKNMVNNLANTSEDDRYSVRELVNFTYDDFNSLYDYGFMFMNYIKDKNPEIFNKLTNHIIRDEIDEFCSYLDSLRNDPKIDKEYREYMDYLIKSKNDLYVPKSSDLYLNRHRDKNINEILEEVRNTTDLRNLNYSIKKSDDFDTVKIEGVYNSHIESRGEVLDKVEMDRIANEMLLGLSELEWSGYDTFTAYFKNHRVDSNNNFAYDLVLHGIKRGEGYEIDPNDLGKVYPKIELITDNKTMSHTRFMGGKSISENGDIVDYKWIIDGKEYSGEYVDILFDKAGKYDVKLIVKDDIGMVAETDMVLEIEKRIEPTYPTEPVEPVNPNDPGKTVEGIEEEEPNDDYLMANSLTSRRLGETNESDMDWYYFDITAEGEYEIKLEQLRGHSCAYTVQKEGKIDDTLYYPTDIKAGELKSKNHYAVGRYYVKVYGFSTDVNKYSIEIN